MLQHRISGLPAVDENGDLVGMVTEGDLLHREGSAKRPRWLELLVGPVKPADGPRLAHLATVSEVMSRPVVTVSEDTAVREVADILQRHRIERVPVVRGGKVTGIVSRRPRPAPTCARCLGPGEGRLVLGERRGTQRNG
jgi:CBS domain-containing protein